MTAFFIDCDPVSQDRALNAALRVKELFSTTFNLKIACQTLSGVLDPEPQRWFLDHTHKFDVIGGLPRRDEGREAEHRPATYCSREKQPKSSRPC